MPPHGDCRTTRPTDDPSDRTTLPCSRDTPAAGDASDTTRTIPSTPTPRLAADCWILSGPTASGKTTLAIEVARRLDAEIVSVDSMAVYRGLDVGTAKPTSAERAAVPHHCLDLVSPAETFSVARWLDAAALAIEAIRARGRQVLLVGGTPLYLRSLRDGLAPVPADDPTVRRRLAAAAASLGLPALHSRLRDVDPVAAARIHPNDAKRIIRALEVVEITGHPLSHVWRSCEAAGANAASAAFTTQMLVVDLPRHILHDRIDRRVEQMFAAGLIEETRTALAAGGIGPTAGHATGYAEAIGVIEGRLSLAEAIDRTQARTRQLAKRQLTWLRSFPTATWIGA